MRKRKGGLRVIRPLFHQFRRQDLELKLYIEFLSCFSFFAVSANGSTQSFGKRKHFTIATNGKSHRYMRNEMYKRFPLLESNTQNGMYYLLTAPHALTGPGDYIIIDLIYGRSLQTAVPVREVIVSL